MLFEAFNCCGIIDSIRLNQCKQGCNGTAFIRFKKPESVQLALKLNKTVVNGREINVERYSTKKTSEFKKDQLNNAGPNKKFGKAMAKEKSKAGAAADPKKSKSKQPFLGKKSNQPKAKKLEMKKKLKQQKNPARQLAKKIAPKT